MCGLLFVSYTRRYIRRRLSLEGGFLCVKEMSQLVSLPTWEGCFEAMCAMSLAYLRVWRRVCLLCVYVRGFGLAIA